MKFFGHFMIRKGGDLNDKYLELSATNKTTALNSRGRLPNKTGGDTLESMPRAYLHHNQPYRTSGIWQPGFAQKGKEK